MTQQPGSWSDGSPSSPGSSAPFPAGGGPGGGRPGGGGPVTAVPGPPQDGRWKPDRVEGVAGTEFAVVHLQIAPVTSGLAVGSLISGIAAAVVAFLVLCFGLAGAGDGWGAWVAGAFTLLGVAAGGGGVGLGVTALRQIRRSARPGLMRFTGRGPAMAGIWCGGIGLVITLLSLALAVVVQVM